MASSEVISDETLRQVLLRMSSWFDEREYVNWLKVLYRDKIDTAGDLEKASKTIDLLHLLTSFGHLSPTDLTILYDTIKATKQFGLEEKIKSQIPSCPNVREIVISKFTIHRQKLIKLGMALKQGDIANISGLYNNPVKTYADSWSLIMDLEHRRIIHKRNMEGFIEKLNQLHLPLAVEALIEETPNVSMGTARYSWGDVGHDHREDIGLRFKRKRKSQNTGDEPCRKDPLMSLNDVVDNIGNLKAEDMPEFFKQYNCIPIYFNNIGFRIEGVSSGCMVFHLSVSDPNALENLWEIHLSGELIQDLAELLVLADLQEEFIDRWSTELDETEYQAAVTELKAKGNDDQDGAPSNSHQQQQQLRQGISEHDFRRLLLDIADWYDRLGHINMLKVLYTDYVNNKELNEATEVMDLFKVLIGSGHLSSTNLTILYDTVKVTDQSGFKSSIKSQLQPFQNISKIIISKFSVHRQRLLELGMALTNRDVDKLDTVYNLPVLKKYKDSWSLIMDLEERTELDEQKMDAFITVLEEHEMKIAVGKFHTIEVDMTPHKFKCM